jgi:hypothetical protein
MIYISSLDFSCFKVYKTRGTCTIFELSGEREKPIVWSRFSAPLAWRDYLVEEVARKQSGLEVLVDECRAEWKTLWRERIDDRVKAEGMANRDFSKLFVERGTVIIAPRAFKPLDFKEILRSHGVGDSERFVSPHPSIGGWGKFSRTVLNKQSRARAWKETDNVARRPGCEKKLQRKQGGRGWLHYSMNK